MKLKSGKEEIVYLLTQVFAKYEKTTGHEVVRNTNRRNYEDLARELSKISNSLPSTSEQFRHDEYPPDRNPSKLGYPHLKYDITGGQIKDAYNGMVSNPRNFLVDSCYIYLFGVGRKGFKENPPDKNLLEIEISREKSWFSGLKLITRKYNGYIIILAFLLIAICSTGWFLESQRWKIVKSDLKILPYTPTKSEIDSLEGIWLVYIGSPQARSTDPNRFHMIANNVIDVKFKDGYFVFNRYGASFDHFGYMQFESPGLVSVHSYINNSSNGITSPRLSLLNLSQATKNLSVISASWNFDEGRNNSIIGIREIYVKQGKGGNIKEIINTIENSSCKCKIIKWTTKDSTVTFQLKNTRVEALEDASLRDLLDEKSIIMNNPKDGIILNNDSTNKK